MGSGINLLNVSDLQLIMLKTLKYKDFYFFKAWAAAKVLATCSFQSSSE